MEKEKKMDDNEFFDELTRRILRGVRSSEKLPGDFNGTPEQAAALFARAVMESDHASAEDISSMRFIG